MSVIALLFGCGANDIGEPCKELGKTDGECESGGVCGKDTSGALRCLKICAQQTDCPATQECNGVEGSSLKACRDKLATGDGG